MDSGKAEEFLTTKKNKQQRITADCEMQIQRLHVVWYWWEMTVLW